MKRILVLVAVALVLFASAVVCAGFSDGGLGNSQVTVVADGSGGDGWTWDDR